MKIVDLDESKLDKTKKFLKKFYGDIYGTIAGEQLINEPYKYKTRLLINRGRVKGVFSYNVKFNGINAKLLAVNEKSLESILKLGSSINVIVPEKMTGYVSVLKKAGFKELGKKYSANLNEYLLRMNYSGDLNG